MVHDCRDELSGVLMTPGTDDSRRPEARPHIDRGEDPCCALLRYQEGAYLVELDLAQDDALSVGAAEAVRCRGCAFDPARDRAPGNALDACNGRLADAFHAQGCNALELSRRVLQAAVGRARGGAERATALLAAVSATAHPAGLAVAMEDDVAAITSVVERAGGVRATGSGYARSRHPTASIRRRILEHA